MATPIDNLSFIPGLNLNDLRFTAEEILQAETLIAESLAARQTSLDVSPSSTIYDIYVRPAAIDYLNFRAMNEALRATSSLKGVQENPDLASDAVVDAILSNYGVARRPGAAAGGTVRINVSRKTTYSITAAQILTSSSGVRVKSTGAFLATSDPTALNHLRLYPVDSTEDQFFFLLPVTAVSAGVSSQLASDVEMTPSPVIPNFISAFTFGAFTGAADQETNQELIDRLPAAISAKNRVSKMAITSELKESFPQVIDVSVQGMGDAALHRGVGGLLPVKGGGFADVWVRTSLAPESLTTSLLATLDTFDENGRGLCSCTIPATASPGYFMVGSVRPDGSTNTIGSYPVLGHVRSLVASGHKIPNVMSGVYSNLQTAILTFAIDPVEGQVMPAEGEEFPVDVELIGLPLIAEIQNLLDDPEQRAAGTDYLVRATVPCFVWSSPITVYVTADVDSSAVQQAVFSYINRLPMGEPLFIDSVVMAIRQVPGVVRVDLPIRFMGRIFCPDGSFIDLASENALVAPSHPERQVVPGNTAFYVSIDDVALNLIET